MSNEPRLDRIEERLAWLERHVSEQDRAMLELAEENSRLKKALSALQSRVVSSPLPTEGQAENSDERPPHY